MPAPKITMQKAALLEIRASFSKSVKDLRESIDEWHSWNDATWNGFMDRQQKRKLLHQHELTLRSFDQIVLEKNDRERKAKKKGRTRLLLTQCEGCGYKARITSMWLEIGVPKCPNPSCHDFDKPMFADDTFYGSEESTVEEAAENFRQEESLPNDGFPEEATKW